MSRPHATDLVVDVHVVEVWLRGVNLRRQLEVGAAGGQAHELQHQLQVGENLSVIIKDKNFCKNKY